MKFKIKYLKAGAPFVTALTGREGIVLHKLNDEDGGIPVMLDSAEKSLHPDVIVVLH
jgi:hypothetical protein